jgi:hypothetical protein
MDEDTFWLIYFALTKRYLPAEVLEARPAAAAEGSSNDKVGGRVGGCGCSWLGVHGCGYIHVCHLSSQRRAVSQLMGNRLTGGI